MTDLTEDNNKMMDSANSCYPKMDLKSLGGGGTKSQNKISRSSSFSNNDPVQEDDLEVIETEDVQQNMTKSKFKHVNIMTDSDEFNLHKVSEQVGIQQSASQQIQRIRSTSSDQKFEESIQEDKIEEESEQIQTISTSKLCIATHSIEESILLDKGEFDCSTPTRPKNTSLLKKVNSNLNYSQFNNKDEIITEDPEKETDVHCNVRISSHKEIKLKVDEMDNEKGKQFTPRLNYMDHSIPIMEEVKEEDILENNKAVQSGDKIHEGEKLIHMSESSGMTSHMAATKINENQLDEDVGDNDKEEDNIDYQKQRRISMNLVDEEDSTEQ